jgi:trans-aconitate 2-methyltransferase
MSGWRPEQYLRFEAERTQPCRDLMNRIALKPRTAIDLGCGPGNSTAVLNERWPDADLTGLDSSESMLERARALSAEVRWVRQEITEWAGTPSQFDLVFSNAALQWVDDHARVFPLLMQHVAPRGVLAVQIPADVNAPAHRIMRERFPGTGVREWFAHEPAFYYDVLAPHARSVALWTTEYLHVLDSVDEIAEWYKSTGLRPFLEALSSEDARERFLSSYVSGLREAFQPRADGRVLFPFRRLFLVAEAFA